MDIDNFGIGSRVRMLRVQQDRTIADIAESCKFSTSLLSKIENGKIVPSVGALIKIANALGTSMDSIIQSDAEPSTIYTTRETAYSSMTSTQKGYVIYPFATDRKDTKMQPFLYTARLGEVTPKSDSHSGHEFIFILKGTMKFKVGSIEYILNEGDSLYFDSLEKHRGTPVSAVVEYLDIFA